MIQLRKELAELDRHIGELERMRTAIVNRIDALERASRSQGHEPEIGSQRARLLPFRTHMTAQQRNVDAEEGR
jgi:hypothetical protein